MILKMKTILVIYSNFKRKLTKKEIGYTKRYAFNTASDVKKGDIVESPNYPNNFMHVVEVFDKAFKYFNRTTGELNNELNNSNQFDIREMKIFEKEADEVIVAYRVESDG